MFIQVHSGEAEMDPVLSRNAGKDRQEYRGLGSGIFAVRDRESGTVPQSGADSV